MRRAAEAQERPGDRAEWSSPWLLPSGASCTFPAIAGCRHIPYQERYHAIGSRNPAVGLRDPIDARGRRRRQGSLEVLPGRRWGLVRMSLADPLAAVGLVPWANAMACRRLSSPS